MRSRGKLIVLGILLLALALAVGNMVFQTYASGRAVGYWGSDAARLMLTASQVEILKLEPASGDAADADGAYLDVGSQRFAIVKRVDISQARGALHFRRALVADNLYLWERPLEMPPPWRKWRYALLFLQRDAVFTLLLAEGCAAVSGLDDARPLGVRTGENGGSPLCDFITEQFGPSAVVDR